MRLLVIEDNRQLVANLFDYFESRGHVLDVAPDGVTGLHLAVSQPYDALILDWMLPRMEGPEVLRRLRADLTKPFALPELEVRLEALMVRAKGRNPRKVLEVADLKLDLATLEAQRDGKLLHLYPACRKLLEVLMRASPGAVTRQQLEFALWGDELPDGDLLRSHVYELRRSVDGPFQQKLIHTLPRVGYRLGVSAAGGADEVA